MNKMQFWITRDEKQKDFLIGDCSLWAKNQPKLSDGYWQSDDSVCLYSTSLGIFEQVFGKLKKGECKEIKFSYAPEKRSK